MACQTSISIVQWGLGVIAPDLQARYGLSAASLGALVNATALGNALVQKVALGAGAEEALRDLWNKLIGAHRTNPKTCPAGPGNMS